MDRDGVEVKKKTRKTPENKVNIITQQAWLMNQKDLLNFQWNMKIIYENCGVSYIHNFIIILSRVYNEPIQRPAPSWLFSSIGRVLHRCRKGQGFESRASLKFFQVFFSKLQKLRL